MRSDAVYLRHVLECIRRIDENVSHGRETFFASHTLQDATLRNLQTMAEATRRLSDAAKARHPEVEWRRIAGFRNVLVHDYLGSDLERIWIVVRDDVPALRRQAETMLAEAERP